MEWKILFAVSWLLLLILIDWKVLKVNIWSGLAAVVLQIMVDAHAVTHGLYKIRDPGIQIFGSSMFFTLGPVFVIGILLAQYHPSKRWAMIWNVAIIALLYSLQELLLLNRGALKYLNWHFSDSLIVNISAILMLSWFSMVILKKNRIGDI